MQKVTCGTPKFETGIGGKEFFNRQQNFKFRSHGTNHSVKLPTEVQMLDGWLSESNLACMC